MVLTLVYGRRMKFARALLGAALAICLSACGGGSDTTTPPPAPAPGPSTFHCAKDSSCPELTIAGDPVASAPEDVFRGYGDPSLEYDPGTGTLWMSYTWLNVLVTDPGPPPVVDFAVRTRLARSDDNGLTFDFVRTVNDAIAETHPDTGMPGWSAHEVSTLVREPSGQWQVLWLRYFDPVGAAVERSEFRYDRSLANNPAQLGDLSSEWIRGNALSPSITVQHDLSLIPELSDCSVFTEPALYSNATDTYLATHCIVIDAAGARQPANERLVLLRQESSGYSLVGNLLDATDAADRNADRLEQADITLARDGTLILIVTPIIDNADPMHQGCVVFDFDDLSAASLVRDASGRAIPRTIITADGNGLGPGLCTYDANSETGILLVITTVQQSPFDAEFSLRATGIHP